MKTNLLQLFSIIVKMYVLNFELLNKIKIRNKINLYSIHLKCDRQHRIHININYKMLLFSDMGYALFLQYNCWNFLQYACWSFMQWLNLTMSGALRPLNQSPFTLIEKFIIIFDTFPSYFPNITENSQYW